VVLGEELPVGWHRRRNRFEQRQGTGAGWAQGRWLSADRWQRRERARALARTPPSVALVDLVGSQAGTGNRSARTERIWPERVLHSNVADHLAM
jgi:uncharacterized protein YraI